MHSQKKNKLIEKKISLMLVGGVEKTDFNYKTLEFYTFCFLEHIFKKWALLKSLCRPSIRLSVCPSVRL
jgi:hypothetical protein